MSHNAAVAAFMEEHGQSRSVAADQMLAPEAAGPMQLVLVRSGILMASMELPNDRRQVLCLYCPGDLIFVDAFETNQRIRFRAIGDVKLLLLSAAALSAARAEAPEKVAMLLDDATEHLKQLMLHSVAIGSLRSDERLATFFLELSMRLGTVSGRAATFESYMRRDDIADYLCMNRDTLSRSMSKLRRKGEIVFTGPNTVAVQLAALSGRTPLAASMMAEWAGAPMGA